MASSQQQHPHPLLPGWPLAMRPVQGSSEAAALTACRCEVDQGGRGVGLITLNRPAASNAFNAALWREFPAAVRLLQQDSSVRVAVIAAAGKNFCGGLDLSYLSDTFGAKLAGGGGGAGGGSSSSSSGSGGGSACPARTRYAFRQEILAMQDAFSCLEACPFPIIAALQGACVGAGVDLATAADLRFCSAEAGFSVKEVDLAITADLGSLQRLPAIIGHGAAAELALTARVVRGPEAATLGLVSACCDTPAALLARVAAVAADIAAKSPLAVAGTKAVLLHTRDQQPGGGGVRAGLAHVALWNSAYLLSEDMARVIDARAAKQQPRFSKL